MRLTPLTADVLMLLAAAIWGFGFIAQKEAMDAVGPLAFNAVRFGIGAIAVGSLRLFFPRIPHGERRAELRVLWRGAMLLGIVVALASAFQQWGIVGTDAGPAGFITGLYVVFTPLLGLLVGVRTHKATWIGCGLAIVGMWFLAIKGGGDGLSLDIPALLVLAGAFGWAVQVLIVDRYSPRTDPIELTVIQFAIVSVLSFVGAVIIEGPESLDVIGIVRAAPLEVAYSGVLAIGVAFFLQIVAQRKSPPAHVAILLSLEAVFAALGGWWLLGETYDTRTMLGCGLMLAGIVASQAPRLLGRRDSSGTETGTGDSES
ncbi:MAG: DMT family transporter [Planctomycetota bacterium]|nr:DMT family transporter [Planctomycetota bacterium]MEE2894219.1 DMT family transporter [Planctomycetota bacterium]